VAFLSALLLTITTSCSSSDSTRLTQLTQQRLARNTPTWSHDIGHFTSLMILTPSTALWLKEFGVSRKDARWVTVGVALAAIVLKESYDLRVANSFSARDLAVGGTGAVVGFAIATRIWPAQTPPASRQRPDARYPHMNIGTVYKP
jgi:hypothetical protein